VEPGDGRGMRDSTQAVGQFNDEAFLETDVEHLHREYGLSSHLRSDIKVEGVRGKVDNADTGGEGSLDLQVITTLAFGANTTWCLACTRRLCGECSFRFYVQAREFSSRKFLELSRLLSLRVSVVSGLESYDHLSPGPFFSRSLKQKVQPLEESFTMSGLKTEAIRVMTTASSEGSQQSTAASAEDPPCLADLGIRLNRVHTFARKLSDVLMSWYTKCDAEDTLQLCSKLDNIVTESGRTDRVVVAGNGNVGKSTIVNALLGEKSFWPTASYCMTSRICEMHFGERKAYSSEDGQTESAMYCEKIPINMVHKSATSEPDEFKAMVQCVCKAWAPSELLKPSVVLVDLPGLDQEKEYMQVLEAYMKQHPAHAAVLVYVLDVKNKICNSDRSFFQELMRSSWMPLSQGLHLLVNKCDADRDGQGDSDEEPLDYDELLQDIEQEASNYCTPKISDLSMKDRKHGLEQAVQKWNAVVVNLRTALSLHKSRRLQASSDLLQTVMVALESKVGDAEEQAEEMRKQELAIEQAESELLQFKKKKYFFVSGREQEIKNKLEARRAEHLHAILRSPIPYFNSYALETQLKEVDKAIAKSVEVILLNDMLQAATESVWHWVRTFRMIALCGALLAGSNSTAAFAFAGAAALGVLAAAATLSTVIGAAVICSAAARMSWTKVDEAYVTERFHVIYDRWVSQSKEVAVKEFGLMQEHKSCELKELKESLAAFRDTDLQRLVQQGFGEVLKQLRLEYAEMMQLNSESRSESPVE
ncbi:unnamed protein product, partial [Symbiodinium necroappetens]